MSIRDEIRFNREIQRLVGNGNKFLQVNKRNVRALLKRKDDENTRIFHDTGDGGYIKRMVLPDDVQTMGDAEKYYMCREYIPMRYSAYDCTGRPFSAWHRIFRICDRFVLYHSIQIDC